MKVATFADITTDIDITEFTRNVTRDTIEHIVSGEGIFDVLMETATEHLKAQFEGNRIREEDYATAYVDIYKTTLQAAVQIWLQKGVAEAEAWGKIKQAEAQIELLAQQKDLTEAQQKSEEMKANLYERQIEGFDDDYKYKLLKTALDSWAVAFSVAKDASPFTKTQSGVTTTYLPNAITADSINQLYLRIIGQNDSGTAAYTNLDKWSYREGKKDTTTTA